MLTFIFQQSYNSGAVPYDWTKAMVVPIFTSGSRADPSNYRPISLTCISCKVMEHIVLSHINKHLTENNIITSFRHGFRQGLSCESQFILATHDWATVLNNCGQTDVLLLDFSKAFDKVSYPKMIEKLEHYGITGKTMKWIEAFLKHQTQFVVVNGSHSSTDFGPVHMEPSQPGKRAGPASGEKIFACSYGRHCPSNQDVFMCRVRAEIENINMTTVQTLVCY